MWFILFNILWLIICDIEILRYVLILNDYLWCIYLLVPNFILKNIYFLVFHNLDQFGKYYNLHIFFALRKYNKWVDTTDSFSKQVVLGLRNLDLFNKYVWLGLTHIVKYSLIDTTSDMRTWIATPNHKGVKCYIQKSKGFNNKPCRDFVYFPYYWYFI